MNTSSTSIILVFNFYDFYTSIIILFTTIFANYVDLGVSADELLL